MLGILFDKVFLPGVYLPTSVNLQEINERLEFILKLAQSRGAEELQEEISTLLFLRDYKELIGVFSPTGTEGRMGSLEPEAQPVVMELEELVYGPPPPNFTPTPTLGFNSPVGGGQINSPSWIAYPANAFLYSRKRGLPLISDSTFLPFPKDTVSLPESDSKALSSYLMAASFSLVLPRIRDLNSEEILEIRDKMKEDIKLFRAAMLSGVSKYTELLGSNPTANQLEAQAKFIAETIILPKIEEMRARFESPKQIFMKKAIDLTLDTPELILAFQKPEDTIWAIVKVLEKVTKKVKDGLDQYQEQSKEGLRSGFSLLLKVPAKYPKVG